MGDICQARRNDTSQHNKRRHCRIILRNIDMPNCILTGKIYLLTLPPDEKNRALSLDAYHTNLSSNGLLRYPLNNYLSQGFIPYEILDDPMSNECWRMFKNIGYSDNDYSVSVVNTGFMRVQHFLEQVLQDERIEYMTLDIQDMHGIPEQIFECEIGAEKLCQAIEQAPNDVNRLALPAVKFKIVRGK